MRIPNKVVCLWSCLTAFTFIHTAVAQDYAAEPLSGAGDAGSVATADYAGSAILEDAAEDYGGYGQEYAPTAYDAEYQDGAYADPSAQGYYPPPPTAGYPPPLTMPPNMNYYPEISPFAGPVVDKTYRQNGIWLNEGITGDRKYFFSAEYMRTGFNRPGTDTVGYNKIIVPDGLIGFRNVNVGIINDGNDLLSDGVRARFTIQNPDTSSLELSAFWVAETTGVWQPFPAGDPSRLDTIRVRGILGLDDGTRQGVAVPYDTDFRLTYKQQAFGADVTWSTAPMYETAGFKLRPLFGAKYLKIREEFQFHGVDSGLDYFYDPVTGIPTGGFTPFLPPYSSDLSSRVTSNLGGPEIGVRYEVGGQNFLLSGQSRFAVLVNGENIVLSGNRIGDGFGTGFPIPTPTDPKPSAFYHTRGNTHVSPAFTQDFQFKGKVFRILPFFNDIPIFANADMLVGYNFTLVGNVARPTKTIEWNLDNPKIISTHSRWYMQAATFGLQWQF